MQIQSLLASLAALAVLSTAVTAQTASYSYFGSSCTTGRISQSIGPVPFTVTGVPRLGGNFEIKTESSASYTWGNRRIVFLLTGVSNASYQGVPLPFDINQIQPNGPWCGKLLVSGEVVTRVPNQASYKTPSTIQIQVPNTPSMAGIVFYQQILSIEYGPFGSNKTSGALSRAGKGTIGF